MISGPAEGSDCWRCAKLYTVMGLRYNSFYKRLVATQQGFRIGKKQEEAALWRSEPDV